ncbi:hypothetical protein, partial [Calidithermus terrae]|uniref:hypothetical protein n=1 Tax=Calidithermus terrae TaxID=1408545 RepID=UPI001C3F727B
PSARRAASRLSPAPSGPRRESSSASPPSRATAWAAWGLGLGLALGLRSWLRSSHLPRWGNALLLGYLGVWTAASLWLMR